MFCRMMSHSFVGDEQSCPSLLNLSEVLNPGYTPLPHIAASLMLALYGVSDGFEASDL